MHSHFRGAKPATRVLLAFIFLGSGSDMASSSVMAQDASNVRGYPGFSAQPQPQPHASSTGTYVRSDLSADQSGQAKSTDANLVNPWGIAFGPNTAFWTANNGTGTSTALGVDGAPVPAAHPIVVTIPLPPSQMSMSAKAGAADAGSGATTAGATTAKPTGIVFNGTAAFKVTSGAASAPARFLFATEDGTISGWAPSVNPTAAVIAVDHSQADAIYKGLALAEIHGRQFLYATNFHAGTVEVFDQRFHLMNLGKNAFHDPMLPAGFAPFGIHVIRSSIYVTYAQQDANKEVDVPGAGKGYVNAFDLTGRLMAHVASKGTLDAPWAVTLAPRDFGEFSGMLLVGNFGDGTIQAFDAKRHEFMGQLQSESGDPITIDGLWDLTFGNGKAAGKTDVLYFTAGPVDQEHGVFGAISAQ